VKRVGSVISRRRSFGVGNSTSNCSIFVSHPQDAVFLQQLKTAVGPPLHPRWVEIEEIVNGELEEAIYGRKTAAAALASADARIDAVLARRP
jgi:maltose-binding protein MalE